MKGYLPEGLGSLLSTLLCVQFICVVFVIQSQNRTLVFRTPPGLVHRIGSNLTAFQYYHPIGGA